jgi:hypothetical protein
LSRLSPAVFEAALCERRSEGLWPSPGGIRRSVDFPLAGAREPPPRQLEGSTFPVRALCFSSGYDFQAAPFVDAAKANERSLPQNRVAVKAGRAVNLGAAGFVQRQDI